MTSKGFPVIISNAHLHPPRAVGFHPSCTASSRPAHELSWGSDGAAANAERCNSGYTCGAELMMMVHRAHIVSTQKPPSPPARRLGISSAWLGCVYA